MEINNLEELKELKCDPLKIQSVNVAEENPEMIYELELDPTDERLTIDHSNEAIKKGTLVIKTFESDLLLPYMYEHNERNVTTYRSYNNFIDYLVTYKTAHLMEISIRTGVKTLKQSDERHLNEIVLEQKKLQFRFNHKENAWKQDKQDVFGQEKNALEKFKKSPSFNEITKNYLMAMGKIGDIETLKQEKETIYRHLNEFFELKNILNEITNTHYQVLKNELDTVLANLNKLEDPTLDTIELASARTNSFGRINRQGYYEKEKQFYPNTKLFFDLMQVATTHRNEKSMQRIEKFVPIFATNYKKSFIDIDSSNFIGSFEEFYK